MTPRACGFVPGWRLRPPDTAGVSKVVGGGQAARVLFGYPVAFEAASGVLLGRRDVLWKQL
jgi:hypothetical protein